MAKDKEDKGRKPDDPRDDSHGGGDHGGGQGDDHGGGPGYDGDDHGPGGDDHGHDKTIVIFVNEKPVTVEKERMTGLAIKQAAIAQGVQIQLDFVLSIELGGGRTELIGDGDTVKVKKGDRFLAIPNDDNS
jgi:hypothetical protein